MDCDTFFEDEDEMGKLLITATCASTRRGLLRRALAATAAAPVLASVLQARIASADDGDNDKDDKKKPGPPASQGRRINTFSSDVSTVAQSAASGDFTSSNAGTDPLTDGRLHLRRRANSTEEGNLQVELRGATPSVSYDVFFWAAASGKARESLGTIGPTNKDGNLNARTPSALSGTNRVGIFVIARHDGNEAGKDEFVASMGG
jgi:hypothetical protein